MDRRWWVALGVCAVLSCHGSLFKISVDGDSTTEVPGGNILTSLLGDDLGFDDFLDMDITQSEELQNQGVSEGDIRNVALVDFVLTVTDPPGGDLSFLDVLSVFVEAPDLDRALVASQSEFPRGVQEIAMDLEDLDLTPYVVSESMTFTVEATGHLPQDDTRILAHYELEVGVTAQGCASACNRQTTE